MNRNGKKIEELDDMKPEYDFSVGERGKYAHRFGEVSEDEAAVASFWREKGLIPRRFEKDHTRFSKSPDFKLYKDNRLVAYCEVKSMQHDSWLDKELEATEPGELAGGLRQDPIYNRISNVVHTAVKQFEAVNSSHGVLNFLVLVNRDISAKRRDLVSVLTGYWDPLKGRFEKTHTQFSEGRIREEKCKVDLYAWMEPDSDNQLIPKGYYFGNKRGMEQAGPLLGLDTSKVKMVS